MNSNQIACFLEIAKVHSFSRAAKHLHLSQPGVSRLIASLEQEVGQSLLSRIPHQPVELTPAGQLYYDFFTKTESEFRLLQKKAQAIASQISGKIRLGFLSGWNALSILQPYLNRFQTQYPQTDICLSFYDPSPLREELLHGSLDGIITLEDSLQNCHNLKKIVFGKVRRMLFISRDYPGLSEDRALTVQDLKNTTFLIVADNSCDSRAFVRNHLASSGINPDIRIVPNVESAISCVHNHLGTAVIDEWSREMGQSSLWHIPLKSYNHAVLAWNPERISPGLQVFTKEFALLPSAKET